MRLLFWSCSDRFRNVLGGTPGDKILAAQVNNVRGLQVALERISGDDGLVAFWHYSPQEARIILNEIYPRAWPARLRGVVILRGMAFAGLPRREDADKLATDYGGRVHVLSYAVARRLEGASVEGRQFAAFADAVATLGANARIPYDLLDPPPQPLLVQAYLVAVAWPHLSPADRTIVKGTVRWQDVGRAIMEFSGEDDEPPRFEPESDADAARLAEVIEELWA